MKLVGFVEHQLPTPLQPGEQKRWLYVTKDIDALLCDSGVVPVGHVDPKIGQFCKGYILFVTQRRSRKKNVADFKKLEDHDEAWVMMFCEPKNEQWRLFGRFLSKDVFVGLLLLPRKECGADDKYQERAKEMIAAWKARLPMERPLRGKFYEDYLSDPVRNKDET